MRFRQNIEANYLQNDIKAHKPHRGLMCFFDFGTKPLIPLERRTVMKRILILLLIVAMIAATFIGCAQKTSFGSTSADTNGNGLRDDVELKIMKAHYQQNKIYKHEDFDSSKYKVKYYGEYNGAVTVMIRHVDVNYATGYETQNIGSITFTFPYSGRIMAYYTDKLFELKELYELGVLKNDDLEDINREYQEKGRWHKRGN